MRLLMVSVCLASMLAGAAAQAQQVSVPRELPADAAGVTSACGSFVQGAPRPRHHSARARLELVEARGFTAVASSNWSVASSSFWEALSISPDVPRALEVISPLSQLEGRAGARTCALIACLSARTDLTADQRTALVRNDQEMGCHPVEPVVTPPTPVVVPPTPVVVPQPPPAA